MTESDNEKLTENAAQRDAAEPDSTGDRAPGPLRRFLDMPADSLPKTLFVAIAICLVASTVVSIAAVSLRSTQEANKLRDKQINILQVAGRYDPQVDITEAFGVFEPHLLELKSGEFSEAFDAATFDDRAAAADPELSRELSDDPAAIGRQSEYKTIYLLRDNENEIDKVILPLHGYGLWSTLYGFIAMEQDGNEIYGLQFYEHGETPGLGAEVDNPRWKALWRGKRLHDPSGALSISVTKSAPQAGPDYHVDALAGATLTSVGVHNLVQFWMGEQGYGPFLDQLKLTSSL